MIEFIRGKFAVLPVCQLRDSTIIWNLGHTIITLQILTLLKMSQPLGLRHAANIGLNKVIVLILDPQLYIYPLCSSRIKRNLRNLITAYISDLFHKHTSPLLKNSLLIGSLLINSLSLSIERACLPPAAMPLQLHGLVELVFGRTWICKCSFI